MNNKLLNTEELVQLKKLLPFGSMSKIAKNAGVSRESVKQVLAGKWYNAKVYIEALKIAEFEKKRKEDLANKLKMAIQS